MRFVQRTQPDWRLWATVVLAGGAVLGTGCAGGALRYVGTPFPIEGSDQIVTGPTTTDRNPGGSQASGGRTYTDPCLESQDRKFVRISMRNLSDDYINYFMVLVAYVNSETYPEGAVCPDDTATYTSFGYITVPEGGFVELGSYCIEGPALYYFHEGGQFQGAGGTLAAGIEPASGTSASYDSFFDASGAQVPVPDWILFHNPGISAAGRNLKVSVSEVSPCGGGVTDNVDPICAQDAWYYVDERGNPAGTTPDPEDTDRFGSYVRASFEIQGTGCECGLGNFGYSELAPSNARAADAQCQEFFRGGRIEYAFIRNDAEPPFPQLVWQVTDSSGSRAHSFDPRAQVR